MSSSAREQQHPATTISSHDQENLGSSQIRLRFNPFRHCVCIKSSSTDENNGVLNVSHTSYVLLIKPVLEVWIIWFLVKLIGTRRLGVCAPCYVDLQRVHSFHSFSRCFTSGIFFKCLDGCFKSMPEKNSWCSHIWHPCREFSQSTFCKKTYSIIKNSQLFLQLYGFPDS